MRRGLRTYMRLDLDMYLISRIKNYCWNHDPRINPTDFVTVAALPAILAAIEAAEKAASHGASERTHPEAAPAAEIAPEGAQPSTQGPGESR